MAKMFYTMDETKAALGKSEDEIKNFVREGRLREFRDGPRQMFKADQVDAIKAQIAGGGIEPIDLGPSDSGSPIGLVDSKSGSGSALSLADTGGSSGSGLAGISSGSGLGSGLSGLGSGLGSGIAGSGSGMMNLKEDTALSADLGLSGTAGGVPSPARVGSGTGSGGPSGSRSGINVFGDDDEKVDPMAQTAISSAPVADLNLEGIGSGSGLLDLTRESDDTSLGAELLDEISPGGPKKRSAAPPDTGAMTAVGGSGAGLEAPRGGVIRGGGIVYREDADPLASALGGLALGAAFVAIFGVFVLVSALLGVPLFTQDGVLQWFSDKNFMIVSAICLGPAVLFFIVGLVVGKSGARK
jgi:hypothetical protein